MAAARWLDSNARWQMPDGCCLMMCGLSAMHDGKCLMAAARADGLIAMHNGECPMAAAR